MPGPDPENSPEDLSDGLSGDLRAVLSAALTAAHGLDGPLSRLPGHGSRLLLRAGAGRPLVLTIAEGPREPDWMLLEVAALQWLAELDPGLHLPRILPARDGTALVRAAGADGRSHVLYLTTIPPGDILAGDGLRAHALLRSVGGFLARLDRGLAGFFHPAAGRTAIRDIRHAPALRAKTRRIAEPHRRRLAESILDRASTDILPRLMPLRGQVIQAGGWPATGLAAPGDGPATDLGNGARLGGLFAIGDLAHAPLVLSPALAAADLAAASLDAGGTDPLAAAAELLLGYDQVLPLQEAEFDLLADLLPLRLAMAVAGDTAPETAGRALAMLAETGRAAISERLRQTCRFPEAVDPAAPPDGPLRLLRRRQASASPAYESFYASPLHLVAGEGAWVIDKRGRRYLDAYNNVPHVGHGNPLVANAIARQAARLAINTRYLTGPMVDYAERLAATLPAPLRNCLFVASGSEANDVAWRMAWAATAGRHASAGGSSPRGALVMTGAYHGVTDLTARLSPNGMVRDGQPPPPFLAPIAAPDPFRSADRDAAAECARALASIDAAIATLAQAGQRPAAMMLDMGLTNNGVLDMPPGYLAAAVAKVRAAGGLFIADEVQAGFGRSGESFWAFAAHGVVPDIVTFGKAIGNGFPLAAVVTSAEIATAFAREHGFFSSTGGNPVACAAGLAVLDCLQRDGLQDRARAVGGEMKRALAALMPRHPAIGEVRGQGFLLGVELVAADGRTPAPQLATAVVEEMRARAVLVGTEGPDGNVVKIRPPMVFGADEATLLVEAFDASLAAATAP